MTRLPAYNLRKRLRQGGHAAVMGLESFGRRPGWKMVHVEPFQSSYRHAGSMPVT